MNTPENKHLCTSGESDPAKLFPDVGRRYFVIDDAPPEKLKPGKPLRLVIIESPYAGRAPWWTDAIPLLGYWLGTLIAAWRRWRNVCYARAAVRDCVLRGEAPIASHLLFTQPGILRDGVAAERLTGIEAGLAWGKHAEATVLYVDRGISGGMQAGVHRAHREGRRVECRSLPGWSRRPRA